MTSYPAQPAPEPWAAGSPSHSDGREWPDGGVPSGDGQADAARREDGHGQDHAAEPASGWPGGQIWQRIGDDWEQVGEGWGWPAVDPRSGDGWGRAAPDPRSGDDWGRAVADPQPGSVPPSSWVPADRAEARENGAPEPALPGARAWLRRVGTDPGDLEAWDPPEPGGAVVMAEPDVAVPVGEDAKRWAMLSYLGIPFLNLVLPLCIYLAKRRAPFVRMHAAQALNLAITVLLYNISALIFGGLLALDEIGVAVGIVAPLLAGLWLTALIYLVRAAVAAGRGEYRVIPGWLCATITH